MIHAAVNSVIAEDGFGIFENLLTPMEVNLLRAALHDLEPSQSRGGIRGALFDKTPDANWKVPWHQDLSIAVQEKIDVPSFGPWSVKAGVIHVQPPAELLETMLAVRIHLDDCYEENGPLRVIPGSHRMRLKRSLSDHEVSAVSEMDWRSAKRRAALESSPRKISTFPDN